MNDQIYWYHYNRFMMDSLTFKDSNDVRFLLRSLATADLEYELFDDP